MKILLNDYCGYPFEVDLVTELSKRGFEMYVCYTSASGGPKAFSGNTLDKVRVTDILLPSIDKQSYFKRWNLESRYGQEVVDLVQEIKPDIVISANTPLAAQRRIAKHCEKQGIKFIFWLQDIISIAASSILKDKLGFVGRIIGRLFKLIEVQALRRSDHIIVIDESFERILEDWGIPQELVSVIPNWSPLEHIPVLEKENEFSKEMVLQDTFNIVYSGTLGMKHDPMIISDLARKLQDMTDLRILTVTDGYGYDFLIDAKASDNLDNLIVLPLQPFDKLPQILATADLLLVLLEPDASKFSVPSKVWSGFCAAKPSILIMPEDNLSARITSRNHAGRVIPSKNISDITLQIKRLRQNPTELKEMGHNARNYATDNFEITSIADRFEKLLE
ncbi:MAG: glycosyltransferase family 4 protein [Candidatus Marinimicrobia bacterium]|nr:glycosyltransferase family 4 protein [Candidatus Neomarinimicrobiota bacterium]MCF7850184.1 glycosyltransferase family 4 protein [Candidatus Neomarinimicrobiota bacterium]